MLYKSKNILTLVTIGDIVGILMSIGLWAQEAIFYPCMYHVMDILHCLGQVYAGTVVG